jgi:hypothetical protein
MKALGIEVKARSGHDAAEPAHFRAGARGSRIMTAPTVAALAEHATAIRALGKRVVADVIEIGARLTECQRILKEENRWERWLTDEFGWARVTAWNFIKVYELGQRHSNFEHVDLPVSALYLLAAPSTPTEARDEILERAQAGEPVSVAEVKRVVEDTKNRKTPSGKTRKSSKPRKPTEADQEARDAGDISQVEAERRDIDTHSAKPAVVVVSTSTELVVEVSSEERLTAMANGIIEFASKFDSQNFSVTSDLLVLVARASVEWADLVKRLSTTCLPIPPAAPSESANTVTAGDPGPIPDFLLRKPKATSASNSTGGTALDDALTEAFDEIAAIGEECGDAFENAPENIRGSERYSAFDDTATTLGELEAPDIAPELAAIKIDLPKSRRARSYGARLDSALDVIAAGIAELDDINKDDPRYQAAHDLRDELQNMKAAIEEGCGVLQ